MQLYLIEDRELRALECIRRHLNSDGLGRFDDTTVRLYTITHKNRGIKYTINILKKALISFFKL